MAHTFRKDINVEVVADQEIMTDKLIENQISEYSGPPGWILVSSADGVHGTPLGLVVMDPAYADPKLWMNASGQLSWQQNHNVPVQNATMISCEEGSRQFYSELPKDLDSGAKWLDAIQGEWVSMDGTYYNVYGDSAQLVRPDGRAKTFSLMSSKDTVFWGHGNSYFLDSTNSSLDDLIWKSVDPKKSFSWSWTRISWPCPFLFEVGPHQQCTTALPVCDKALDPSAMSVIWMSPESPEQLHLETSASSDGWLGTPDISTDSDEEEVAQVSPGSDVPQCETPKSHATIFPTPSSACPTESVPSLNTTPPGTLWVRNSGRSTLFKDHVDPDKETKTSRPAMMQSDVSSLEIQNMVEKIIPVFPGMISASSCIKDAVNRFENVDPNVAG